MKIKNRFTKRTGLFTTLTLIVIGLGVFLFYHQKTPLPKVPIQVKSLSKLEQMKIIIQPMGKVNKYFDDYTYQNVKKSCS